MREPERMVINTGPLIALVAALGNLQVLRSLYQEVLVPFEVCQEILAGGEDGFAVAEFSQATWLVKRTAPLEIQPLLVNLLDTGEAAVIQLALTENIPIVCIDEVAGRRVAQLSGLSLTGSIGVLLKAKQLGVEFSMVQAIQQMQAKGVRLSQTVIQFALAQSGEGGS